MSFPLPSEYEIKKALSGLYVGAKHKDTAAVNIYCQQLDEMKVCYKAQNLIFEKSALDKTPGIPSKVIDDACNIARHFQRLNNLKNWHSESHPLTKNPDGSPMILFHGSLRTFDAFDRTRGEGSMFGRGVYLTSSARDASRYASKDVSENPDIPAKAEFLEKQLEISYAEAREVVVSGNEQIYPLFAKVTNPLVIGAGEPVKADYRMVFSSLKISGHEYPEAAARQFVKLSEYGENDRNDMIIASSSQRIGDALKRYANDPSLAQLSIIGSSGFRELMISLNADSIIMNNVNLVYPWMEEGSSHYYVRSPERIKSIFNSGVFNDNSIDLTDSISDKNNIVAQKTQKCEEPTISFFDNKGDETSFFECAASINNLPDETYQRMSR